MKFINLLHTVVIALVIMLVLGCEKSLEPLGVIEPSAEIAIVGTVTFEELQQQHDSIATLKAMQADVENIKNINVINQVIEAQTAALKSNAEMYLTEQYQGVTIAQEELNTLTATGLASELVLSNAETKLLQANESYSIKVLQVKELLKDYSIELSPSVPSVDPIPVGVSSAVVVAGISSVTLNTLSSESDVATGPPAQTSSEQFLSSVSQEVSGGDILVSSQTLLSSQQTIDFDTSTPVAPVFIGQASMSGVPQENSLVELVHGVCIDSDNSITPLLYYTWYVEASAVISGSAPAMSNQKYYSISTQDVGSHIYGVVTCIDGDGIQIADTTELSLVTSLTQSSSEHNSGLSSSVLLSSSSTMVLSSSSESVSSAIQKYFNSTSKTLDLESDTDENVQLPEIAGDWQGYGITLEAWVKWESIEKDAPIISITNGAYNSMILLGIEESNNGLKYTLDNGTPGNNDWAGYNHANYFSIGVWTHVAIAIDGDGSMSMYKNGVAVVSNVTVKLPVNERRYVNAIGKGPVVADGQFDGQIDNVRIWNIKRTAAQIADNLYNDCDNLTSTMGLVAGYDFNKESGSHAAMDNSGNGNTGSLNNMSGTDAKDWLPQVDFGSL